MIIYDSSLRKKTPLEPLNPGEVRIYVCGPTVYDDSHLGHARSAISFDLLARFLELLGHKVTLARNFTDIDDKLINKCLELGRPLEEVAATYIEGYLADMGALGVRRPTFEPRATEFIGAMTEVVSALLAKGLAYSLDNGDVYLEVAKDSRYGSLSAQVEAGSVMHRVAVEEGKRDPRDFALWKAYKGSKDIGYESALGRGRPGWHLECSAMVDSVLAYEGTPYCIDIHAGGYDLFFPHHENEASQTRGYTGRELAKYWMHNGFVTVDGEKMSKSLGNSFFVKHALEVYHGEILRNYLIGTHYRLPLNFNEQDLLASKKRLDRIYRLKRRLDFRPSIEVGANEKVGAVELDKLASLLALCDPAFKEGFMDALKDDLNISLALSVIEEFIKATNEKLDSKAKLDPAAREAIFANLTLVDLALGLGRLDSVEYFQLGVAASHRERIEGLIEKRAKAKAAKDFKLADSIRAELEAEGIALMDKPGGPTLWEKL